MSMREEFEAWFFGKKGITELGADNNPYASSHAQAAWWAWQTSRNAVVIELPPPYPTPSEPEFADDERQMDAYHAANGMRHVILKIIEAAGLKVKV